MTTTAVAGSALALGGTAIAADSSDSETSASASVTFDDQKTDGETVIVASATLPDGGYVTIHNDRLLDDKPFESVIGVSDAFEAGTRPDIHIELFEDVPGRDFEQNTLREDTTLIAMPHYDSDYDGTYDFVTSQGEEDGPYTKDDNAVVAKADISVPDEC